MDTYSSTPYQSSASRQLADKPAVFLFVGGVPLEAKLEQIKSYFSFFGRVQNIDLPTGNDGRRKGCAFVRFFDPKSCDFVLSIPLHSICGKTVAVRPGLNSNEAATHTRDMQLRKLFVSNLPSNIQEEQVQKLFSSFGVVTKILVPKGGIRRRNFCYVIMEDMSVFRKIVDLGVLLYQGAEIVVGPAAVVGQIRCPKRHGTTDEQSQIAEPEATTSHTCSKTQSKPRTPQNKQILESNFSKSDAFQSRTREFLRVAIPAIQPEENYRFNIIRKAVPIGIRSAISSSSQSGINSQDSTDRQSFSGNLAICLQTKKSLYCPF